MNKDQLMRMTPRPTQHFKDQMMTKGFSPTAVVETLRSPDRVYPAKADGRYAGQWRITGNGMCIMVDPDLGRNEMVLRTIVVDGKNTPPREDQMNTAAGRAYAAKYAQGLNRDGTPRG